MRFPDAQLQRQFKDYLAALAAARSKEKRSVYIDSTDAGERHVTASYMIPAPVWKSSYRLIFGEKGQPTLEGWAIVDNTTGEDWTKVQLSLVSGRPDTSDNCTFVQSSPVTLSTIAQPSSIGCPVSPKISR